MEPIAPPIQNAASSLPILSVAELTAQIKGALRAQPRLREVWVEGEVGQVSISAAGHCYFTLKDERAQLKCVIFRDDRIMMPFEARTGLRLVAHGSIDVFDAQGVYQLYVRTLQPSGFGDLALRFEALKAKLAGRGTLRRSQEAEAADVPAGDRRRDQPERRRAPRHPPGTRSPLADGTRRRVGLPGAGAGSAQTIVAALRRVAPLDR